MPIARFVQYSGKEIFEVNFENLSPSEAIGAMDEAKRAIVTRPHNSILALTFVSGARFDSRVNEALRAFTAHNKPYVKKSAVVGVSGLQQMLLSGVRILTGRDIRGFDNVADARDWLIGD